MMLGAVAPLRDDWSDTETVTIGAELVRNGQFDSESQVECLGLMIYWGEQRRLVEWSGMCSARCRVDLVENAIGEKVCPHTYQPCKKHELREVVTKWEMVNR